MYDENFGWRLEKRTVSHSSLETCPSSRFERSAQKKGDAAFTMQRLGQSLQPQTPRPPDADLR